MQAPSPIPFDEADWPSIYSRLGAYATWKAARLRITGAGPLPLGRRPEDVVQQAITQTIEGSRAWDPETYPDLLDHLRAAVDSITSNLVQRAEHRHRVPEAVEDRVGGVAVAAPDPETALADGECADALEAICAQVVGDDDRYEAVRLGIEDGESRSVVAEMIGATVNEVYAMTKTFVRRMRKALATHPCWSDVGTLPPSR